MIDFEVFLPLDVKPAPINIREYFFRDFNNGSRRDIQVSWLFPVPRGLEKYENLSIFGGPRSIPEAVSTLGPFVCDKQIKLSNEELLILY